MNKQAMPRSPLSQADWTLWRAFAAVLQTGSLNKAAAALACSQPTLSRQIAALEEHLGQALFERTKRGLRPTELAQSLAPKLRQMDDIAREATLMASGLGQAMAGTVRLTASEIVSTYVMPPILAKLREQYPQIQLELVVSNTLENLLERDADIAVRMVNPSQAALVAQKVAQWSLGLYASRAYRDRKGPLDLRNLSEYDAIGADKSDIVLRGYRSVGFDLRREFFGLRCDNQVVAFESMRAGAGIGPAFQFLAARYPELVSMLSDVEIPSLPVWLTAHRELRAAPRLRVVFDALAKALAEVDSAPVTTALRQAPRGG